MIRCILFDRDGTLGNLDDVRFPETFTPFCDVAEVFRKIKARGYTVGIITNQSSIARGTGAHYDFAQEFTSYGCNVWEICPHDTQDNCNCRKPKSGLLLTVAKRLNVPLAQCMVVGDRLSDVACAENVGAQGVLVLTGNGKKELEETLSTYPNTIVLNRFDEILNIL